MWRSASCRFGGAGQIKLPAAPRTVHIVLPVATLAVYASAPRMKHWQVLLHSVGYMGG
jgi:hypothetical protein